jgi:hypothetical protein
MRTKNQESAKISMGHLVKRDTCLSRPQAKRVGGAPAIMRNGPMHFVGSQCSTRRQNTLFAVSVEVICHLSAACCLLFTMLFWSMSTWGENLTASCRSIHQLHGFASSSSNRLGWRGSGPQSGEGWRTQPRNRDMRAMHRDPSPDRACSADRGPTKGSSSLKVGVARRREGCPIVIAESAYSRF